MKYKFMPMFWGDFFANTLHLTAQEAGAYLFLIGHAWEREGKIAVEDLQRVARVSNYNWHKVRSRLEPFFNTLSVSNFWIHERVRSELTLAAELSKKRKEAALQMHSKRSANGGAKHPLSTVTIENLTSVREGKAETAHVAPTVTVNYRDPGVDYRSPPRKKAKV